MLQEWYAFLTSNPITYLNQVVAWLQYAFAWVMTKLDDILNQQKYGWSGNLQSLNLWTRTANRMHQSIRVKLLWLYQIGYLGTVRWVNAKFLADEKWEGYWHQHLWQFTDWVANRIYGMIADLRAWVTGSVYKPLQAAVNDLKIDMLKWAYYSYQLLSNPPKLAEIAFWPLFGVFQKDPFTIGRIIGDWLGKLIYANTVRTITLAEQIITDIL